MSKLNVGILFGGRSAEHEVSLQSAKNIIEAMDKEKYNPIPIGIDKTGKWFLGESSSFLLYPDDPKLIRLNRTNRHVAMVPQDKGNISSLSGEALDMFVDVVFPILHGPYGEDGTVQGLLKLAEVPFVGSGVLGSAIGMDKDIMKRLLRDGGLPVGNFLVIYDGQEVPDFRIVEERIGLPFFVKPANMGSSVGVNKVSNESEYKPAIIEGLDYDKKVLIEEYIEGREIECSVLGNDDPIASVPGEIISNHPFYSYKAKYIDENGAKLEIPARLDPDISERIRELAVLTFKTLCCEGMGRVDFFLRNKNEIIVNEINTIPGFTSISMFPRLWEASGISHPELIDRLIQLAFDRFKKEKRLKSSQDSMDSVL